MKNQPQPIAWLMGSYECTIEPDWIDMNDHLNSAHYKTIADISTRQTFRKIGLGDDYFASRTGTVFQLELHVCFERELLLGDPVEMRAWFIAYDAKRIHHFHEIFHRDRGYRAATVEMMSIHIDPGTRRSAPFAPAVMERLEAVPCDYPSGAAPSRVSSRIGLKNDQGTVSTAGRAGKEAVDVR